MHGLWCCPSSVGCLWCSWLGFGFGLLMGRVWFCGRPCLPPAVSGSGVRCGRVCWAWVSAVPSPSWLGCRGVFFALLFFFGPGLCGPCPSIPFLSGWAGGPLFFFFVSVSLFPVGRCSWLSNAGFGWVVPLCLFRGPVFGAFWGGGGVGRLWWCWRAVWRLWAVFAPFPPPPSFFFRGGGACLFLPLPPLGWRTHWPAFSVVFRAAVFSCVLFGRVPAPWVGWAM